MNQMIANAGVHRAGLWGGERVERAEMEGFNLSDFESRAYNPIYPDVPMWKRITELICLATFFSTGSRESFNSHAIVAWDGNGTTEHYSSISEAAALLLDVHPEAVRRAVHNGYKYEGWYFIEKRQI